MKLKILSVSNSHASYSFDAGDGEMNVFFNPDDGPDDAEGLNVFDMAFGAVGKSESCDVDRNVVGAIEALKKFLSSHKPDMVIFHTTEQPAEVAAAMAAHAKHLSGYLGFKYITDAMASFAFLKASSDRKRLQDYLDETGGLPVRKAQKL